MGGVHRIADLGEETQRLFQLPLAIAHASIERRAGDIVHHEVEAAGGRTAVVDRHDRGMVELTQDPHFAIKAGLVIRTRERPLLHHFDRNPATGRFLKRLIDNPLSTAVNLALEFVARQQVTQRLHRITGEPVRRIGGERSGMARTPGHGSSRAGLRCLFARRGDQIALMLDFITGWILAIVAHASHPVLQFVRCSEAQA